jgi:hypothetical protein
MSASQPNEINRDRRARTLGAEITELYGLITAATYDLLVRIRAFDADELWAGPGLCSCAHWLNWQCGIGMNAAREKVRVARALAELPKISAAFRDGLVSYSKVRAMTRVATPGNEDYLLMIARHGTAHHVETLVRGYRRAKKLNDPQFAELQHESRLFEYHWDVDGSLVFRGRLPAEVGAMLMKALEKAIECRSCEQLGDEAIAQRRADGVAGLAESFLAAGPADSSSAERYQVMLHVTAEISGTGELEGGPAVTAETSKRICCDTSVTRIIEDGQGEPLSIGRKARVIPPAMRRALNARDRHCRFPGCNHRHFIDAHHIRHWADGGETGLDNLVLLCRHHHRLVHEGGFGCEKDAAGGIVFSDAAGMKIPSSGHPKRRYRGNVLPDLLNRLEDRHVHAKSVVSQWEGERMDPDLAVELLIDAEELRAGGGVGNTDCA